MSELKEIGIRWEENGELHLSHVYLKSEADKVIAEKDKEIAELKNLVDEFDKDFEIVDNQNERLLKIVRHQKHKRCLDKAEMCKAKYDEEDARINGRGASWDYISQEMKYWERWEKRWLELAEEPTWAKFLQLIRKEAK